MNTGLSGTLCQGRCYILTQTLQCLDEHDGVSHVTPIIKRGHWRSEWLSSLSMAILLVRQNLKLGFLGAKALFLLLNNYQGAIIFSQLELPRKQILRYFI